MVPPPPWKSMAVAHKTENRTSIYSTNSTSGYKKKFPGAKGKGTWEVVA